VALKSDFSGSDFYIESELNWFLGIAERCGGKYKLDVAIDDPASACRILRIQSLGKLEDCTEPHDEDLGKALIKRNKWVASCLCTIGLKIMTGRMC